MNMIVVQNQEGQNIQQQLASASLKYHILQVLKSPENCRCQFENEDLTKGSWDVTSFKTGCSTGDTEIARIGKDIGANVKIDSLKVVDIIRQSLIEGFDDEGERDTSLDRDEYGGILRIVFSQQTIKRAMRPVEIPLRFTTLPSSVLVDTCGSHTDHTARMSAMLREIRIQAAELNEKMTNLEEELNTKITFLTNKINEESVAAHNHGWTKLSQGYMYLCPGCYNWGTHSCYKRQWTASSPPQYKCGEDNKH